MSSVHTTNRASWQDRFGSLFISEIPISRSLPRRDVPATVWAPYREEPLEEFRKPRQDTRVRVRVREGRCPPVLPNPVERERERERASERASERERESVCVCVETSQPPSGDHSGRPHTGDSSGDGFTPETSQRQELNRGRGTRQARFHARARQHGGTSQGTNGSPR